MRILVVEDEPTLCGQLVQALQQAGHTVETAADGATAQYLGEVEEFDAAVLDLGLPVRDGLTVLRAWRAQGRVMPVMILTDRKSTRLNSSHVRISYAVFCLKKKKKKHTLNAGLAFTTGRSRRHI